MADGKSSGRGVVKMFRSAMHVILSGAKNPTESTGPFPFDSAQGQGDTSQGGSVSLRVKGLKFRRVLVIFALLCLCSPFIVGTVFAREKPKTHFLSWESHKRPEEYRRLMKNTTAAPRRFKVTRERVASLKKTSFWNRRPYQFATPALDGGKLFVGVDVGVFYAIDAKMEKDLWEFKPEGPVHAKAAVSDGVVYFGDTKAFVYALDGETGQEKWRAKLDTEILAAPLVAGSHVYVTDMSGRLYALDRSSGVEVWHTNPNDKGIGFSVRRAASPVEAGGLILLGTSSGLVVAYRVSDGAVAWVRQLGDRQSQIYDVDSTPLIIGDKAYVASADGETFCLESQTGRVVWNAEAGGANDIIFHDGKIYASGGGVLSALDPVTGDIFWQQDIETPEISSPVARDHHIGIVSTVDKFYVIDTETGDIGYDRFVAKGAFGDPVISDDFLYILTNKGKLYSFKIRELPPKKQRKK